MLALEGKKDNPLGVQSIFNLMDAIDNHIPTPVRPLDKPFLMAVEDIFTISGKDYYFDFSLGLCLFLIFILGRGTVVTGAVEQGVIKTGDNVEIVGWKEPLKAVVTGLVPFVFHISSLICRMKVSKCSERF